MSRPPQPVIEFRKAIGPPSLAGFPSKTEGPGYRTTSRKDRRADRPLLSRSSAPSAGPARGPGQSASSYRPDGRVDPDAVRTNHARRAASANYAAFVADLLPPHET